MGMGSAFRGFANIMQKHALGKKTVLIQDFNSYSVSGKKHNNKKEKF